MRLSRAAFELGGANGIRFGARGKLYVAQFLGDRISAVDIESGTAQTISGADGAILAPDDLVFGANDEMFATEVMEGRVSARDARGSTRVLAAELRGANGITLQGDRLFADEFRSGGRVLEIYTDGRVPRVITADIPMPNALCAGPDGWLYAPAVAAGEIWRVHPDRGRAERWIAGLSMPTAVKFDGSGNLIVTQAATGIVSRIELASKAITTVATLRPGIDNCEISGDGRLFVSHFVDGGIAEISSGAEKEIVRAGLLGPWGLGVAADGALLVADGMRLLRMNRNGAASVVTSFARHGFPGFLRNVQALPDGSMVLATSGGVVARCFENGDSTVLASDLDRVMGLCVRGDGSVLVAEQGSGKVLELRDGDTRVAAAGFKQLTGLAADAAREGWFVADAAAGEITHVTSHHRQVVMTGLVEPHGLAVQGDSLFVVDRALGNLLEYSLSEKTSTCIADQLPTGAMAGGMIRSLPGTEILPGPLLAFTGIACDSSRTLYVCGDADGSIMMMSHRYRSVAHTY